jgi:hypothetical protein
MVRISICTPISPHIRHHIFMSSINQYVVNLIIRFAIWDLQVAKYTF